jgi:hypothetical protein
MFKFKRAGFEAGGKHRSLTFDLPEGTVEEKRVYTFPGGDLVEIEGVVSTFASRHGNHSCTTKDGMTHIIPWGWICLTIPTGFKVLPNEPR